MRPWKVERRYRPAAWLRELTSLRRAPWQWGAAPRAGFCVSAPLVVGIVTGHQQISLFVAIGAMVAVGLPDLAAFWQPARQSARR